MVFGAAFAQRARRSMPEVGMEMVWWWWMMLDAQGAKKVV